MFASATQGGHKKLPTPFTRKLHYMG